MEHIENVMDGVKGWCTGAHKCFPMHYGVSLKKITGKITAQCAAKNNAYSLCCIFRVFY